MILPIVAYGEPVLRKKTTEIKKDHPKLDELISNMFETMYAAHGVGLAAPQIGLNLRVFVVDARHFVEDEDFEEEASELKNFKKVFINPRIIEEWEEEWKFKEGCLSIPDIREDVSRKSHIRLKYFDEKWQEKEEEFSGIRARVIQHEYDHIEGTLFTDKLSGFKKRLIKGKLSDISKGKINVNYRMKFPKK